MSTLSVLPLQFTVNEVGFSKNIDTQLHLKKRRENLVFKTNSHQDNINIAYMISEATNPADNLSISDRSTSLVQNRIPTSTEYVTKTTSSLTLQVSDFLLTDTYTAETPTVPKVPLFYVHKLANYNSDNADWDDKTLLSLSFADDLLQKKNVSEYYLDEATGEVYNNLENTYDQGTESYEVFFVKYTVRVVDGTSISVNVYHELINNTPVYHEASFADLDPLGRLKTDTKAYLIEELPGGDSFSVTLPTYKQYSYQEKLSSRINILSPSALSLDDPWYVRVRNGKFLTSLTTSDTGAENHLYYIPEYNTQAFAPFPPYKFYPIQQGVILSKNLIKVGENIAYDMGLQMFIDIFVKDSSGAYTAAYTNNPLRIGEFFYETILYQDAILSFDELGGFIEISEDLNVDTDIVEVSYFSEELEYEFTNIDFNPTNNRDALRGRTVLYAVPETPLSGELSQALHYLKVDAEGKVVFASQPTTGATDFGTVKLLEDFDTAGRPLDDIYYDIPSTASGLISLPSGESSIYADEFSWIDKYSVESVLLTSGVPLDPREYYNFQNNPRFLVLGDVYVGEAAVPEAAAVFDVRIRGGGIKDNYRDAAKSEQPELMFFWDENSRFPYPGMGSFLVEVPREVLSDYGGRFSINEVRQVVERHAEFGTYAILKEYGTDPTISGILPASGEFTIGWPSYGSDVSYTVHFSTEEDIGFEQFGSAIDDAGDGNNYVTVTGLTPGSTYYTHLKATGSDGIEHQGPTTYTVALTY